MPDPAPNPDTYPGLRRTVDRWRARNPRLRHMPGWKVWLAVILLLVVFAIAVLPYIIPLGGEGIVPPETLADPGGFFTTLDDGTLYAVHAPGDGPAVLLLHGFGGSTVSWRETIPALAEAGYDVYALDMRGFGLSDKGFEADYNHAAQAQRVRAWMDAVGLERATLVGHSMGGDVAARIALSAPDRVSSLVLVSASVAGQRHQYRVPGVLLDVPFLRRWAQIGLRRAVPLYLDDILRESVEDDSAITPELIADYRRVLRTPEWELALLSMLRAEDEHEAPVSELQAPTLLLWGSSDETVPPEQGERLERLIPGAELVVLEGAGHLLMHEQPEAFQAALLDFLERSTS